MEIQSAAPTWKLSFDYGGTNTGACLYNEKSGQLFTARVPSNPEDPSSAVMEVLSRLLEKSGAGIGDIGLIICGTTLAAGAILNQSAARTALLVTRGFKDLFYSARRHCDGLYPPDKENSSPVVSRNNIYEVGERLLFDGQVHIPLDENSVIDIIPHLEKSKIESVAICFLHSYKNPDHENRVRSILKSKLPSLAITVSHEILPFPGELERTGSAVLSAAVSPLLDKLTLGSARKIESAAGKMPGFFLMQSDGSVAAAGRSSLNGAGAILSGYAGGVLACSVLSGKTGRPNILSFDLGGTTSAVGIIHREAPLFKERGTIGGYPTGLPAIDINLTCVPDCTGANLLLGRLNPGTYQSGPSQLLSPSENTGGLTPEAAEIMVREANSRIAGIMQQCLKKGGYDPGEFTLVSFGSAGPLHAAELAVEMGIPQVLTPVHPGLFPALGMLTDIRMNYTAVINTCLESTDPDLLFTEYQRMEEQAVRYFQNNGIAPGSVRLYRSIDLQHKGQQCVLNLQFPSGKLKKADLTLLGRSFRLNFNLEYGFLPDNEDIEIARVKLTAKAESDVSRLYSRQAGKAVKKEPVPREKRMVIFNNDRYNTPVYDRFPLIPFSFIEGPAVVEQDEAATLIWPGMSATIDAFGNIIISMGGK